jgi:hypothetical protein
MTDKKWQLDPKLLAEMRAEHNRECRALGKMQARYHGAMNMIFEAKDLMTERQWAAFRELLITWAGSPTEEIKDWQSRGDRLIAMYASIPKKS